MKTLSGRILTPQGLVEGRVSFTGQIEAITSTSQVDGQYILPGFIDLHVHGGGGTDTMEGEAAVRQMVAFHARHGTTALLPTTVTAPMGDIEAALKGIAAVMRQPQGYRVLGAHLEGPYINPQKLGAQPPFACNPTLPEVQRLAQWVPLRVVTLAAELPGALEATRWLSKQGCRVQQGHTAASYEQALAGFQAGACGFTHFFNAMTPLGHRQPGVVGLALEQAPTVELILDGLHVHPAAIRAVFRSLPGAYGVTDAVAAAGMPEGSYGLGRHTVYRRGGGVYLSDGGLAGSALTMDQALRNLLAWGCSPLEASQRLSLRPAQYLGLDDLGQIAPGCQADLVVFSPDWQVQQVYIAGEAPG